MSEEQIHDLLEERPDLEEPLEAVLEADESRETWTFDDLSIESGPFGELVSHGVVESVGDEYRLANPAAVRRVLGGESERPTDRTRRPPELRDALARLGMWRVDRTTVGIILAGVAVVGFARAYLLPDVYRSGDVVLSGNDPYYYRFWIEQVASDSAGPLDFGALGALSGEVLNGEPLMAATLWWLAELFGGSVSAIGHVLAWYPVLSALLTAGLVYALAVRLTADRRVGLAAVLMLAIIPGHALRTGLGFADHHAFDYPWLAATALLLVVLVEVDRSALRAPRAWLASGLLGGAVAGQVLAWEAGPLLIAPVGLAVVALTLVAVARDRSPLVPGGLIAVGLAIAGLLSGGVHEVVGWHTAEVAYAPVLVLVGTIGVLGVAEAIHRTTGDVRHLLAVDFVGAVLGLVAFSSLFPSAWETLASQLDLLIRSDAIAETAGILNPGTFGIALLLGFALVVALPGMVWAVGRARTAPGWAVAAVYAWYFLLLAVFQVRFVGELATFLAVFAGLGFVWLAAWIDAVPSVAPADGDLAPLRLPDRGTIGTLLLLFVLVGSLGIIQVPIKHSQVLVDDGAYESAAFIEERAAALDQSYPDNYVLSDWGRNRMYNYFVNGRSRSFSYAQSNYLPFATGGDPDAWYSRFNDRVGYVVMERPAGDNATSARRQLTTAFGSATASTPGVARYRPLFRSPGGSHTVFAVVQGAVINGTTSPGATVTVSTEVSIPGAAFTYERHATADDAGTFAVRVPNPGQYRVELPEGSAIVTVPDGAVRNGTRIPA